jgi:glutathione S-transferase
VSAVDITLYAIPFSTNVERVALALAHKGLTSEVVMLDARDRTPAVAISGQPLVPVVVLDGEVLVDSSHIIEVLEGRVPDPPLFPQAPARRAEVRLFVDWFNRVWKRPPNELTDLLTGPGADPATIGRLQAEMRASLDVFEQLLDGRDHLAGDEFSAADCAAFPFLKYGLRLGMSDDDDEPFHHVLADNLALGAGYPRLAAWLQRVDQRPRVEGI